MTWQNHSTNVETQLSDGVINNKNNNAIVHCCIRELGRLNNEGIQVLHFFIMYITVDWNTYRRIWKPNKPGILHSYIF